VCSLDTTKCTHNKNDLYIIVISLIIYLLQKIRSQGRMLGCLSDNDVTRVGGEDIVLYD
jgi:hypothetical protein